MLYISPRIERLIDMAIDEDEIGFDVASGVFSDDQKIAASLVAKEQITLAGLTIAEATFERVDSEVDVAFEYDDGDAVTAGDVVGRITGRAISILRAERIALNFLGRMSGIATKTAEYVSALGETTTRIVDTRKTLPGYRELDKYAVRCGGGANHRFNLSGGVMIKDNHIAAAGSIRRAVKQARRDAPLTLKIEVETTSLDEVEQAVAAGADVIMLDNMTTDEMSEAVDVIRQHSGDSIAIEASGNITLDRLPELADIGLDYISSGALTHSVDAADFSLQF